jgi:hypothetical protein
MYAHMSGYVRTMTGPAQGVPAAFLVILGYWVPMGAWARQVHISAYIY